ncbi:hypothetical protein NDN08_008377 [Rhodosorus marinus]|uniref:AP-3 complex subunit beta n=1 Tax=Rhodosorus marinus TaxID=101924 RepID=A0AAV8V0D8_9RHOD|nr:hypothetical protein NDN08_008377 [Rhodosorus marinus]
MEAVASMQASVATAAAARLGGALSDAQYFESGMVKPDDIRKQLDVGTTKDKLDAMKRIVALISLGKDASHFYPSVVKNVVAQSFDVRKLVYMYLVHYAEDKPDLALLAINTLQKDLSHPSQLIRALALRVLSSIRVKTILQVVIHGITAATKDSSPYVRKTAANAIPKVFALDEETLDILLEPLGVLLGDRSGMVIGSAVAALQEIAPSRYDLLHPHFRSLCGMLIDLDEWSQTIVLNALLTYARDNLRRPSYFQEGEALDVVSDLGADVDDFEGGDTSTSFDDYGGGSIPHEADEVDPDLKLLLSSSRLLLKSINSAVTLSVVSMYYHLASPAEFKNTAVQPLMRMLRLDRCSQFLALKSLVRVVWRFPQAVAPYAGELLVSSADGIPVRKLKMKVLTLLLKRVSGRNAKQLHNLLLPQITRYVDSQTEIAQEACQALGNIATTNSALTHSCVRVLTDVIVSSSSTSAVSAAEELRKLLQRQPGAYEAEQRLLAKLLAKSMITKPDARASIIWIVGEFAEKIPEINPEVLRRLVVGFGTESRAVKLQTLTFAAKLVARMKKSAKRASETTESLVTFDVVGDSLSVPTAEKDDIRVKLFRYLLDLAGNDADFDVRERARLLKQVYFAPDSNGSQIFEIYADVLLRPKPLPAGTDENGVGSMPDIPEGASLGSLAETVGRIPQNFHPLPNWTESPTDASARDNGRGSLHKSHVHSNRLEIRGGAIAFDSESELDEESSEESDDASGTEETTDDDDPASKPQDDPFAFMPAARKLPTLREAARQTQPKSPKRSSTKGSPSSSAVQGKNASLLELLSSPSQTKKADEVGGFNLIESLSSASPNRSLNRKGAGPRKWRRLVETWNSNGLEIDYGFCRVTNPQAWSELPVAVRLRNSSDHDIFAITCKSVASGAHKVEVRAFPTIEKLTPTAETEATMTCVITTGRPEAIPIRVSSSVGSCDGEMRPTPGEILRPDTSLTLGQFMTLEHQLGGTFANEADIEVETTPAFAWQGKVRDVVVEHANVAAPWSGGQRPMDELLLTGLTLGSEHPVLISIRPREDHQNHAILRVSCEDLLLASSLLQTLKSKLLKSTRAEKK